MKRWASGAGVVMMLVIVATSEAQGAEGFGAGSVGGTGRAVCHVTTLADTGEGSLRACVAAGGRYVVFDVGGTIVLDSRRAIRVGPYVTIDGATAPAPGVTITGAGLLIDGAKGAHDVVVRHVRIRDAYDPARAVDQQSMDCILVRAGAYNVVLEHVSVSGCGDGGIDITGNPANLAGPPTRDITVQNAILGPNLSGKKAMLIKYGATRVSLIRTLFVLSASRNPEASREDLPPDPDTTVQMVNSVIWDTRGGYGARFEFGVTANIEGSVVRVGTTKLQEVEQGLIICQPTVPEGAWQFCREGAAQYARAYTAGNVSLEGAALDGLGTEPVPFPAPPITATDACTALDRVRENAGAQPRDAIDTALASLLDPCGG